jgi:hypothetical protein
MRTSEYKKKLAAGGLDYVAGLNLPNLVSFDIETTGLPGASGVQLTQAGMVLGDYKNTVLLSSRCHLNDSTMSTLRLEAMTAPGTLKKGSRHWVLRYNGYSPVFKSYQDYLQSWGCPHKLASLHEGRLVFVDGSAERPLGPSHMLLLEEEMHMYPDEARLLSTIHDCMAEHLPGRALLGQNILDFDIPFVNARAEALGMAGIDAAEVVDTVWISRIIIIPALQVLSDVDPLSGKLLYALTDFRGKVSSHLQDMRKVFAVMGGQAHEAVGDCITTLGLVSKFQEYAVWAKGRLATLPALQAEYRRRLGASLARA